ncbi:hypothetical protein SS05631_b49890 (plasmid) [Sinorhizobium sp. CCBAU 05631]|nr:hypothetical protein SS05631_b49890 [Sinorhizobium sp. CCBAU 05631]
MTSGALVCFAREHRSGAGGAIRQQTVALLAGAQGELPSARG